MHEAMAKGKAINVLASVTLLSNNGTNVYASFDGLKENNMYYFHYLYNKNYYGLNRSMSDSFFIAKKSYVEEILKHTDLIGEGNYQFNLSNAIQYHFLGLLEK